MAPVKYQAYLLLTLAVLFWAGNFVLGRAFHMDIPPVALAFWRWAIATLLVLYPASRHLRADWKAISGHWPIMVLLSVFGIASFNTLVYSGLHHTQAINALLIQSLMPVLIVLMSFVMYRDKISARLLLAIMVSLSGAVTIICRGDVGVMIHLSLNRGDLYVFVAVICYATYSVLLKKKPLIHPMSFVFVTFGLGSLMLVPFYLWEAMTSRSAILEPTSLLVIGYVAIFPSIVSFLCYNKGVELIGPNRAGLFIHLMPVFGSVMAVLCLDEPFYLFHALGMVLIGAGIYLTTMEKRRSSAADR
ncbi:MAG: DMT family transporter [Deltaproteobacteria bacterium]|nr:DMT family transporter [Deltaproteobacteria bacterium]